MITLFSHDKEKPAPDDELVTSGSGTAQLSVTVVENDFVAGVYEKLASVYDLAFGPTLQPGRIRALEQMDIQPGERVLEVGVGTGINLSLYPQACRITGIDFSSSMLEKARERVARGPSSSVADRPVRSQRRPPCLPPSWSAPSGVTRARAGSPT